MGSFIAIEGTIGVGKTSLARLLQPQFAPARLVLEVVEANPFLSDFYGDRERYGFQTQIFFLLSRYRQQLDILTHANGESVLSDYLLAKDRIFATLNLDPVELDMHTRLYTILSANVPTPDLVVYLRAEVDVLMHRITKRDRSFERAMPRDYIANLNQAYETFFATYDAASLLIIDTNHLDFVSRPADLDLLSRRIHEHL
ncbi:MAG: deoxynucleoside kinase [Chloroflexi bacterium]|nr:deoxynucleoside kinase [Chloroflexota bacterium]MBU1751679.1 deoxynucleoside kinase [Chloroflexota bacterium]